MKTILYSVIAVGFSVGGFMWLRPQAGPTSIIQPAVVAYQRTIFQDETSARITFARTEILGVRADESVSRADLKNPAGNHSVYYTLLITDVRTGRHTVVDPLTESKTTYPSKAMIDQFHLKPANSCPGQSGGEILGFPVVLENKSVTFPDRNLTIKYWRAPALNCLPLREEHRLSHANGKGSFEVLTAIKVTLGEPPTWMFEIPAAYTERTPSQVFAESAKRLGHSPLLPNEAVGKVYEEAQGAASQSVP
jgi:hypothetical protein